jgi:hypothetical protein
MAPRRPQDVRAWLETRPSLAELRAAYPADADAVQGELSELIARGDLKGLEAAVLEIAPKALVRRRIAAELLRELALAHAARGTKGGRIRFNLLNGWVAQRLLFARGLERKPVSLWRFRLLWPLLWQRRLLMPLVGPKGIYCFYSAPLIERLAERIGDRRCLEIAAGDGTLARFLADAGVDVVATDDHSWTQSVTFPASVLREDAETALRLHAPQVVIASWPPAGNSFERAVFETEGVELYVVIGSRHRFASGNWTAYEEQTGFTHVEDAELGRLVLPPEVEPAVHVFERRPSTLQA